MVLGTEREMVLYHREIYSSSYNSWITVLPKERDFFSLILLLLENSWFSIYWALNSSYIEFIKRTVLPL